MVQSNHEQQWKQRVKQAVLGGGPDAQKRQADLGKYDARTRISLLVDDNSFTEIDQLATSQFMKPAPYSDGVVTGFASINQRRVAVYAQDFTIKGGSLGKRHAEKICKIMDMAVKIGCPIIGIIDSGGARIEEGIHALEGYGNIFKRNVRYSGVVPQISIIVGPCAGGATYSPALTDFVFMTEHISQMFITGPQVIADVVHQVVTKEELGGTGVHGKVSGVAHVICPTEVDCFEKVKALMEYLPSSYLDDAPAKSTPFPKTSSPINVPLNPNQSYSIHSVINAIFDSESFFEIHASFASNIVVGFTRLDGIAVGIVANQPNVKAGTIDIDASCKAARFIQTCDSFDIPLITLVDTPGYLPGVEQEHSGIIRHGAKLAYAYAQATVPKITLVLRKAFGGAYIVMGSKGIGADLNFAWPQAQIAVLGAKAGVSIMHGKKIAAAAPEEKTSLQNTLEQEYSEAFLNPFIAAENGYIDAIIEPCQSRTVLVKSLHILRDKVEKLPAKKIGNIPL